MTVVDGPTGAVIVTPKGYIVTPNLGIPEWHFVADADTKTAPPLGTGEKVLCALQLSSAPRVGATTDPTYLRKIVDEHMRGLGAEGAPPILEPTENRFLMISEWRPRWGNDVGKILFFFHTETSKIYAYMSCVTSVDASTRARPIFRQIWDGINLPK